ncbi:MAG: response regulator [Pirellulaceae bacterium]
MRSAQRLSLVVLVPALLVCAIGVYSSKLAKQALESSIRERTIAEASAIMAEIDRDIHGRIVSLDAYAEGSLVRTTLTHSNGVFAACPDVEQVIAKRNHAWHRAGQGGAGQAGRHQAGRGGQLGDSGGQRQSGGLGSSGFPMFKDSKHAWHQSSSEDSEHAWHQAGSELVSDSKHTWHQVGKVGNDGAGANSGALHDSGVQSGDSGDQSGDSGDQSGDSGGVVGLRQSGGSGGLGCPKFKALIQDGPLSRDLQTQLQRLNQGFQYPIYDRIIITNRYGAVVAASTLPAQYDLRNSIGWRNAKQNRTFLSGVYQRNDFLGVDIGLRIEDDHGEFAGVLLASLSVSETADLLAARSAARRLLPGQRMLLLTRDGKVIADVDGMAEPLSDGKLALRGLDVSKFLTTADSILRTDVYTDTELVSTLVASSGFGKNPGTGWILVFDDPQEALFGEVTSVQQTVFRVSLVGLLITSLLSGTVVYTLAFRLTRLRNIVRRLGAGEEIASLDEQEQDEIGDVANAVHQMSARLADKSRQLDAAQIRLVELDSSIVQRAAFLESVKGNLRRQSLELTKLRNVAEHAGAVNNAFLGKMGHSLRTPMTIILGYAELLAGEVADASHAESVETVERNSRHLLSTINDVIELSRIESKALHLHREFVKTWPLLQAVWGALEADARRQGETIVELATLKCRSSLPVMLETDAEQLQRVLQSLSQFVVDVSDDGAVNADVVVEADGNDQNLVLVIQGNCRQLNASQCESLFHPFATSELFPNRQATGLELAIASRLAELLGGSLAARMDQSKLVFEFMLPITRSAEVTWQEFSPIQISREPTQNGLHEGDLLRGLRVLLVEDGEDTIRLVTHLLHRSGVDVDVARDGQEGVELALVSQDLKQRYDLVLMDIDLPIMDGVEAVALLRKAGYRQPIIALTAGDQEKVRHSQDFTDRASKPITKRQLLDLVSRHSGRAKLAAPNSEVPLQTS